MKDSTTRLNKALANAGVCSRRKADELISKGLVTVNDKVITDLGTKVLATDIIKVSGKKIVNSEKLFYILLNKPIQVVSTVFDPQNRTTVIDLLPAHLKDKRLYPVGRLDYFSEGLILLTNDGELTYTLTHPSYQKSKTYEVTLRETPDNLAIETMRKGMTLSDGTKLSPVEVELKDNNVLKMILRQGINRQIRKMCQHFNLTILKLQRIAIGNIAIGDLGKGECRSLTKAEIESLQS